MLKPTVKFSKGYIYLRELIFGFTIFKQLKKKKIVLVH